MGQAREAMDRVTRAMTSQDLEALETLYAPDAVAETPDQGTLSGRDAIVEYFAGLTTAFPDASYDPLHSHETADTAIDEGYFVGTNTGELEGPGGERMPATGRQVRVRECDVLTVRDGVATSHRFYFDMLDFLGQLGLTPEE
jgi:ketosteroid isomerase-like protein